MRVSPVFHVSLLRPVDGGPLMSEEAEPSLPSAEDIEGALAYRVWQLLDPRVRRSSFCSFSRLSFPSFIPHRTAVLLC